jgi:hypothetical protein
MRIKENKQLRVGTFKKRGQTLYWRATGYYISLESAYRRIDEAHILDYVLQFVIKHR